jgi:hypothetical protein
MYNRKRKFELSDFDREFLKLLDEATEIQDSWQDRLNKSKEYIDDVAVQSLIVDAIQLMRETREVLVRAGADAGVVLRKKNFKSSRCLSIEDIEQDLEEGYFALQDFIHNIGQIQKHINQEVLMAKREGGVEDIDEWMSFANATAEAFDLVSAAYIKIIRMRKRLEHMD